MLTPPRPLQDFVIQVELHCLMAEIPESPGVKIRYREERKIPGLHLIRVGSPLQSGLFGVEFPQKSGIIGVENRDPHRNIIAAQKSALLAGTGGERVRCFQGPGVSVEIINVHGKTSLPGKHDVEKVLVIEESGL